MTAAFGPGSYAWFRRGRCRIDFWGSHAAMLYRIGSTPIEAKLCDRRAAVPAIAVPVVPANFVWTAASLLLPVASRVLAALVERLVDAFLTR